MSNDTLRVVASPRPVGDTGYKNVMLISPDSVKSYGDLNYNVSDDVMGASIRAAQNVYLQDVIGTNLLDKLKELVYNSIQGYSDNIDEDSNEQYKTLLDEYIKDCLAYKVVSEICVRISLKIRNIGVSHSSDTNINSASLSDIKYLTKTYDTYYASSLNRMIDFLKGNKNAFPEIDDDCVCGKSKPNLNNKYGNTGLYLGK